MITKCKLKTIYQNIEACPYRGEESFDDLKAFADGTITNVYKTPWSEQVTCLFTLRESGDKYNMLPGMALCRNADGKYFIMSTETLTLMYEEAHDVADV